MTYKIRPLVWVGIDGDFAETPSGHYEIDNYARESDWPWTSGWWRSN